MKIEDELQTKNFRNEQHKAALNLMFTSYRLKSEVTKALKPFGLTSAQYNVMRILKGSSPQAMCVKQIGQRMIEPSSNVPRILDRLELKKYVTRMRSESDGRETLIELTPEGAELLKKVSETVTQMDGSHVNLTDSEARLLNDLLDKSRED